MKKRTKHALAIAGLFLVVCLGAIIYLATKREAWPKHTIRPEGFPAILIAPQNAESLNHSTPSNDRRIEHTYGLNYTVAEPYPSNDSYKFIEKHLASNEWHRLKYALMYPEVQARAPIPIPSRISPAEMDGILATEDPWKRRKMRKEPYAVIWRQEDWMRVSGDERITVVLYYAADLLTGQVHRDKVYVSMDLLSQPQAWILPYITKYRELHPDEFADANSAG